MTSAEWPPPPPRAPEWVDPPRRSRRSWLAGAIVTAVTAAVVVVIGTLAASDDAERSGAELAEAFARYDASVPYDAEGYVELSQCPVGDPRTLVSAMAEVVDVDPVILDGEVFVDAYEEGPDYPAITQCFVSSDPDDGYGPTAVGFSVAAVPDGSYRDFLLDGAYDPDIDVSIDVQRRRAGDLAGDVFGYCYRAADLSGCGADLVDRDDGVVLSVYVQGSSRTADEAVRALEAVIDAMAEGLLVFVAENPVPSTVSNADT